MPAVQEGLRAKLYALRASLKLWGKAGNKSEAQQPNPEQTSLVGLARLLRVACNSKTFTVLWQAIFNAACACWLLPALPFLV